MALEKVPDALSFCSAKVERRKQKDWELIFVGEGGGACSVSRLTESLFALTPKFIEKRHTPAKDGDCSVDRDRDRQRAIAMRTETDKGPPPCGQRQRQTKGHLHADKDREEHGSPPCG